MLHEPRFGIHLTVYNAYPVNQPGFMIKQHSLGGGCALVDGENKAFHSVNAIYIFQSNLQLHC